MDEGAESQKLSLKNFSIDNRLKSVLAKEWGIEELFPPQAEALPHTLCGKNLMLAIPTASGKSLVAHITMIQRLLNDLKGRKGVYIVPLKALASEKFEELSKICSSLDLDVGLAIGDRSNEMSKIEESDILVCTSEKLDSMLRTDPSMISEIGIVVADEFHLIQDPIRGPTLEILLSRIRHHVENVQIIALSATVGNVEEISQWLDAELVISNWRPVILYSGTLAGLDLTFHSVESPQGTNVKIPKKRRLIGGAQKNLHAVMDDTIEIGKQMLVFVSSRSSAQKEARELSAHIKSRIASGKIQPDSEMAKSWDSIAKSLSSNNESSATIKALENSVRGGVGFHHAGLTGKQRKIIEQEFRAGSLVCIVATPTLAQGVNLPASRVIVRDCKRWSAVAARNMPLPIMEVKQMMGRAGRPGFDEFGESFLVSKSTNEAESLVDFYLRGKSEKITSKLANPSALHAEEDGALLTHLLSIIATAGINDRDAISRFICKTFLASQMDMETLEDRVDDVICWLCDNGMIIREGESDMVKHRIKRYESESTDEDDWVDEMPAWANSATKIPGLDLIEGSTENLRSRRISPRKGPAIFGFRKASAFDAPEPSVPEASAMVYSPTPLGKRISRLYLYPISGRVIYDGLSRAIKILSGEDSVGQISPFSLIHLASCTPDFLPLWPRKSDFNRIQESLHRREREFLAEPIDLEKERRMKGALVAESWMEEEAIMAIEEDWSVQPGDLRSRIELLEWLLFSMKRIISHDEELSVESKKAHKVLLESIDEVHRRVKFGCKPDILGLVLIKGVGRVRAREMSDTLGLTNASDVYSMTERDIAKLSDLRGWSPKLVENLIISAKKSEKRIT